MLKCFKYYCFTEIEFEESQIAIFRAGKNAIIANRIVLPTSQTLFLRCNSVYVFTHWHISQVFPCETVKYLKYLGNDSETNSAEMFLSLGAYPQRTIS